MIRHIAICRGVTSKTYADKFIKLFFDCVDWDDDDQVTKVLDTMLSWHLKDKKRYEFRMGFKVHD